MRHHEHAPHTQNKIGFVTAVKKYLITIEGLPGIKSEDLVVSENNARALVTSLKNNKVFAMVLDSIPVKPGDRFSLLEKKNIFSFGKHLLGRVIDVFGDPLDGGPAFPLPTTQFSFDKEAAGMASRQRIEEQFLTGITMVDTLIPLAKGQRELIFGPAHSGKTIFLRDIILNQKTENILSIYAVIGKPASDLQPIVSLLFGEQGNKNTIILAAPSSDPTPKIAIAPSVAIAIAEHFRMQGKDVLLVLDNLAAHAKYLREIALLQGRLPGRESYPGDIFYQHARIIERAGNFNKKAGGGSITLLPVLETGVENYTNLIPTNIMAATDGHLMFSTALRAQGVYPAISEEQSVTRVGRVSQTFVQKQISTKILTLLAQYRQEKEYVQFGAPISKQTQKILKQGEMVYAILRQNPGENISKMVQVALLSLVFSSFCEKHDALFFEKNRDKLMHVFTHKKELLELQTTTLSLEKFLEHIELKMDIIENVCQT